MVQRDKYYNALLLKAKANRVPKMDEAWVDYRRSMITGWQLIA